MPTALVRRCLLAGAPSQVCAACGKPWVREVHAEGGSVGKGGWFSHATDATNGKVQSNTRVHNGNDAKTYRRYTTGFTPTCACNAGTSKAVVLDPFVGSGTVPLVARELGHHAVGVDLSLAYLRDIARERLGLAALHAWTHGQPPQPVVYNDLPLFGG